MNTFYRIVFMFAMLLFYSTSWADAVPLPCEPHCTVDPCTFAPERCKKKGGPLNQTAAPTEAAKLDVNEQKSDTRADAVPIDCPPHCTVDPCRPPLGPKPGCPGYPTPGPVGVSVEKAQVVDPCQYGCPKSECPQCPEGGPIGTKAKAASDVGDYPKSMGTKKATQSSLKQKAANSCDYCVCDKGTVKPSCTECCR